MADLVRHAVGVDLVDVALRQALGEDVPDEVALPRFSQPLAIRFLTAEPGPLPTGRVTRIGSLEPVLAAEGVVQADTYLQVGETIRPVRLDGDRRGYVIAVADTNVQALARAEAAAGLLQVEVESMTKTRSERSGRRSEPVAFRPSRETSSPIWRSTTRRAAVSCRTSWAAWIRFSRWRSTSNSRNESSRLARRSTSPTSTP